MDRRVGIVTGGSRGIGLAIADRLAAAGSDVVIAARDTAALAAARDRLASRGCDCEAVVADVGTAAGARAVIDTAVSRFGRVDILVNNAGDAPLAPIPDTTDDVFDRCLRANVASVFFCTRAVWPVMQAGGGGTIVNLSSVASIDPFPGFAVYGGAKAWVNIFTKAAADEGKPHGIRVFAVAPGAVETMMLRDCFPDFPSADTLAPDDVARLVEACWGSALASCSGQTLFIRR
jgi:3-oxoacyl-[acyl-carrier protein] reductase